jgi:hypothetical protein
VATLQRSLSHADYFSQLRSLLLRCLVAASNGGRFPSCGFPNRPLPQLTASTTLNCLPPCRLSLSRRIRRWVFLLWIGFASPLSSVRIAHRARYWKFFLVHYIQVLCQSVLCKAGHAYLTYLMLQRQLSHLNGRKLDHRQVSASYILCMASPCPMLQTCSFPWFCILNFFQIMSSIRTSQETHYVTATKPNRLMLFMETVAVYCENHTEYTDTLLLTELSPSWETANCASTQELPSILRCCNSW